MTKAIKPVKKEVIKAVKAAKTVEADGSEQNPLPWVTPFPAAIIDENGADLVFVRAIAHQEVAVNGMKLAKGEVILPASFAHSVAHALSAPYAVVKE